MASVEEGLSSGGLSAGDINTDAGFAGYMESKAKIAQYERGEAQLRPRAPRQEPPRPRGKNAAHHVVGSSVAGKAKLSPAQISSLLSDDDSRSVESGLTYGGRGSSNAAPTGRQLADEAIARTNADPEQQAWRARRQAASGDQAGQQAELLYRRAEAARQSGDAVAMFDSLKTWARESPESFTRWLEIQDDAYLEEMEALGFDSDDEEMYDTSLPSWKVGQAVRDAVANEDASEQLMRSQALAEQLGGQNIQTYDSRLRELGIFDGSDEGVEYVSRMAVWIADATGVNVGELAVSDPEAALDLMGKAHTQLNDHVREGARQELLDGLFAAETKSVAEGLVTPQDLEAARHQELMSALNGGSDPQRDLPSFDPAYVIEPEESKEVPDPHLSMTTREFIEDVTRPEESSLKAEGAWTRDEGEGHRPVSFEEASRDHEAEAAAAETARRATSLL
jgi:hypothetical protein